MSKRLPHKATAWAILAGVSYVLCFPRFDLPALGVLFLPAFLSGVYALETRRQAWKIGFLLSAMVAWGGFHWIIYVAQNFGGMPLPFAIGLLLLFCLVAAPQMVAFAVLGERLRFGVERLPLPARPLFWAALYVALEYLAHFFKIFPENLGNTWLAFPSVAQAAAIGGAPLLTFFPAFLGASLFYLRRARAAPAAVGTTACALLLILAAQAWGSGERRAVEAVPGETVRVGFVQHNMDDAEKRFAQTNGREVVAILVGKLMEKTRELAARTPKPDLILWPETSYPMTFPTSGVVGRGGSFALGYANLVKEMVEETKVPLLIGGYLSEEKLDYNGGILLGADGRLLDRYRKQELLIFGEYFPLDSYFPSLKTLNPMMGDFGRGPGPEPLDLPWKGGQLKLGVNICYEAILPEYMRGYVKRGARLLVNLTKDSWFGDTFEPWQHFQLSVLRSIEHRVPMVRATNTGLSGLVKATGETVVISPPYQEAYEVLDVNVPLTPRWTPYTAFGEWFAMLCLAASLGAGAWAWRRGKAG